GYVSARDAHGSGRDELATVVVLTKKPSTSISGGSSRMTILSYRMFHFHMKKIKKFFMKLILRLNQEL
ncbi:hypothetical protein K2182_17835, partial [Clostridium estertheticum]|nr:hypothetical protein [Clostridium estertheticum]